MMNRLDVLSRLVDAFDELFASDKMLFDLGTNGVSEQTVTFRLGHYLQRRFADHHVDCEYNRLDAGLKVDPQVELEWMKPDVIVHVRREKGDNLLVVEAKKAAQWAGGWRDTSQKLEAFTRRAGNYEYRLGVAWRIAASQDPEDHLAVWFLDGAELCRSSLSGFIPEVSDAILAAEGGANEA
jgi:hypothetical protein